MRRSSTLGEALVASFDVVRLPASVVAVAASTEHGFSKQCADSIMLLAGVGVEGDAHAGATVQHRSRVASDPTQPNLRQVHLIHSELLEELRGTGFTVEPGELGENITTAGIDLLDLPVGSLLKVGREAILGVTGLRNPCLQIDRYQSGLLSAVAYQDDHGRLVRKTGVMTVVLAGGTVRPGDLIEAVVPPPPHRLLDRV
jgi:MOSC domain-containing protein YiiM